MFVEFNQMSGSARVWVYQADRSFSVEESKAISELTTDFLIKWTAHGAGLKSSFQILYNYFLVISVDEDHTGASGCSIDASVHFVQSLERQFGINFFDRNKVAIYDDEQVFIESLTNIKNNITSKIISDSTSTFNNLVKNISELDSNWLIPVSESWLKRYFKKQKV